MCVCGGGGGGGGGRDSGLIGNSTTFIIGNITLSLIVATTNRNQPILAQVPGLVT